MSQIDIRNLTRSAQMGDADAQCKLGECYYNGSGVERSHEKAVQLFQKSADQGNVSAQNKLGLCYKNGEGVERSLKTAFQLFLQAAKQRHSPAQANLGMCYMKGEGTRQYPQIGVEWFRRAAKKGDKDGQYYLGMCHYEGVGVEQSFPIAVEWFRKAAQQGHAEAQNGLGWCYKEEKGVERSYEEALKWFRKSVEQGYAPAQDSLAECYEKGLGVEKSLEKAVEWYRKAAQQGVPESQANLERLLKSNPSLEQKPTKGPSSTPSSPNKEATSPAPLPKKEEPPEIGSPKILKGKLLGRGGMGTVYSCRMEGERGTYALKIAEVPKEGRVQELALQEVELLRSLDHPNIVPLVAIEQKTIPIKSQEDEEREEREEIWMVMELFDDSLKGILKKKEEIMAKKKNGKWFKEKDMLKWMTEILSGLEYLHSKKIAHRDIKSDNVLVGLRGIDTVDQLCLTDFGVSRIVGEESQAATVAGTTAYKAPEVNPHVKYDPRAADMWSVGVLLCELAVGKPIPFPLLEEEQKKEKGNYPNILELAKRCCNSDPKARPSASQLLQLCQRL